MKNESLGETIVSIFRKEWEQDQDEETDVITNGTRRNERCKVNKQVTNQKLDWKYVNGLIEFAEATYNQPTIVKRIGDLRDKYRKCKKELKELQQSIDGLVQEKVDEIIQKDYDVKLKDKVEFEKLDLQERIETQSKMIKNLIKKSEIQFGQIEQYKQRPSKESYDDLQARFDEYVNATKLKKSESTSSLSSEDDSKYKKKYKSLKKDYEKLQMKHLKLKEKLDDNDDTSDEDDTSSDDD
tara:strand:+ start:1103 stop:1822 length:720 start_codon:yes stop_codon:yes gene_type:complete